MRSSAIKLGAQDVQAADNAFDAAVARSLVAERHRFGVVNAGIAFDVSPVATVLCDLAGQIIQANPAFHQLFALEPSSSLDRADIAHVCAGKVSLDFIDALSRDGLLRQMQLAVNLPDQERLAVLCTASRIDGEESVPCWLIITFDRILDATSNRSHDHDLAALTQELERLADIGYWRLDLPAGAELLDCEMTWSSGMFSLLDCKPTRGPRTFKHWLNKVAPTDRAKVAAGMRDLAARGGEHVIEYRLSDHDQHHTVIHSRSRRIDAAAASERHVLIGVEQRQLKYENSQKDDNTVYMLQTAVQSSESPMYAIDRHFHLVWSNDAFRAALGSNLSGAVLDLEHFTSRLPDAPQRRRVAENLRRALSGERRIETAEVYGDDVESHRYDFTYTPVRAADGTVIGVAVLGVDVTARRPANFAGKLIR